MKGSFIVTIMALSLFFTSCKRQAVEKTKYLSYGANPSYTGIHPVSGLGSNIYIQDKSTYLQFFVDMAGIDVSKAYKLHIHLADSTLPYGYSGNPVIDLGTMTDGKPVSTKVTYASFDEFTQNFRGYYVVHDPDNVNNDTTTLLIFGKIGNWE